MLKPAKDFGLLGVPIMSDFSLDENYTGNEKEGQNM